MALGMGGDERAWPDFPGRPGTSGTRERFRRGVRSGGIVGGEAGEGRMDDFFSEEEEEEEEEGEEEEREERRGDCWEGERGCGSSRSAGAGRGRKRTTTETEAKERRA
ncbi:hypothetical protein OIDMADRAFT_144471 [Oidiodendron maius Zn]|uniref:Uncharacterized protein n=1 Tax=Oidiodendron maius (strain Zn) TaxID=913774 RepID=A0A0C3CS34_OIDMZ|nr:hypothetical protein OIDMADRAFT_144471 [Oidiodendron maius Zn]